MQRIICILAFFFIYWVIGGLATTNILRLTAGNTIPVLASKCVCDNCGAVISPFFQLPIISFILCKGKCRHCKTKLPIYALMLEIAVCVGMFAISCGFSFSILGVSLSFLYYECVRLVVLIRKGRRKDRFYTQYFIAVVSIIPFYIATVFAAVVYLAIHVV